MPNTRPAPLVSAGSRRVLEALDWSFFRRTLNSTAAASVLVGLNISYYDYPGSAGVRYMMFALWATFFFALTALIFQSIFTGPRPWRAAGFAALKIGSLALMCWINFIAWPVEASGRLHVGAMIGGVATPFLVLLLRALGLLMDAGSPALPRRAKAQSHTGKAESNP